MTISSDYAGSNLVFVVGCPRSGTTWLQRLLASHPSVKTGQESDVFDLYVGPQLRAWRREIDPSSSGRGGVGLACYFKEDDFFRVLKGYTHALLEPMVGSLRSGEVFVEKTPSHVLYVPEIVEILPRARFIHVLRDARDTVASLLGASRSWGSSWAPGNASRAASMWVSHVQAARDAARTLPPWQFHEVKYEDLHSAGSQVLAGVMEWLGIEWSADEIARALDHNRPDRAKSGGGTPIPLGGAFGAASGPVVREPEGFVRKAHAGTWREDLTPVDRLRVWRVARHLMVETGYPWPRPW